MWSVQALAQPASVQISLYPDFAEVADELALEHEETQALYFRSPEAKNLETEHLRSIAILDKYLEEISGEDNLELWTIGALESASEWTHVRELASHVIKLMKWELKPPPIGRDHIYVKEK